MPKIKKIQRRKKYNANINRKRMRNKVNKIPTIYCKDIKKSWEMTKSVCTNLKEMGLAYNPNQVIPIPNTKEQMIEQGLAKIIPNVTNKMPKMNGNTEEPSKKFIVESLETDARAPRQKLFRLPNGQVQFVTYMLDKYGENYKAMSKDPKNHFQLTWKQIRAKINQFKKIPEQYNVYLEKKMQETV